MPGPHTGPAPVRGSPCSGEFSGCRFVPCCECPGPGAGAAALKYICIYIYIYVYIYIYIGIIVIYHWILGYAILRQTHISRPGVLARSASVHNYEDLQGGNTERGEPTYDATKNLSQLSHRPTFSKYSRSVIWWLPMRTVRTGTQGHLFLYNDVENCMAKHSQARVHLEWKPSWPWRLCLLPFQNRKNRCSFLVVVLH